MHLLQFRDLVQIALKEDLTQGDVTTDHIFTNELATASIITREAGVVAGLDVAGEVFNQVDPSIKIEKICLDGTAIKPGDQLMVMAGEVASLLKAERTALNFLQRMCGVATATCAAVRAVGDTKTRIVDTRKTTPGLRILEKYAVRMGGGENHRFHLGDMVMIKDNHIAGAGSVTEAVQRVRQHARFSVKVEVEVTTMDEVEEALTNGVDIIMLDNMSNAEMAAAVAHINGRTWVEASGGITLERVRDVAATGVDFISLGYLTHGYRALDLSMTLKP
ncbi:MAG: carboxylating nicotinate-nucleotide diphosphorylase [Firmicutes bacterium]|nr:carboxylating nicotinate-nucleotide diphosphorylase [Bacillota bacterium]